MALSTKEQCHISLIKFQALFRENAPLGSASQIATSSYPKVMVGREKQLNNPDLWALKGQTHTPSTNKSETFHSLLIPETLSLGSLRSWHRRPEECQGSNRCLGLDKLKIMLSKKAKLTSLVFANPKPPSETGREMWTPLDLSLFII